MNGFVVFLLGVVSLAAMGAGAIWVFPRIAGTLNDALPRGGIARRLAIFPLKDVDYVSQIRMVRFIGYFAFALAAYMAGIMIWDFLHGVDMWAKPPLRRTVIGAEDGRPRGGAPAKMFPAAAKQEYPSAG